MAISTVAALLGSSGCQSPPQSRPVVVAKWEAFETSFRSQSVSGNPLQDIRMRVSFVSPTGAQHVRDGFWDGGSVWRVRFAPDELGAWTWATECSVVTDAGLHARRGEFVCTAPSGRTVFKRHGPIRVERHGRYLEHQDRTPFFWLADTAWSGPLRSTAAEWEFYTATRAAQRFSAVQWIATQYRAAPSGDIESQLAYSGTHSIAVNPRFFQRLDEKIRVLNNAGLLSAPVLLWAHGDGPNRGVNPGWALPEDQAILLARYMVARWNALDVLWILPGDGDYRGTNAARWKRIGQAVFDRRPHAPVALHPGGKHWNLPEFLSEPWLDIVGYQSGHGDDDATLRWLIDGPPSKDWHLEPARPFINLEPPYENHIAYQSKQRIGASEVRRAVYRSLLIAPTAGVSYGGHGVWGWDDGSGPPVDHPNTGVPLPWQQALLMPAAREMTHVAKLFRALDYSRLRPAPDVLAAQPGAAQPARFVAAAQTAEKDLTVLYLPESSSVMLKAAAVPANMTAAWHNPREGGRVLARANRSAAGYTFTPPGVGDWVLVVNSFPVGDPSTTGAP